MPVYPTKADLEEIWQTGPVGWLKDHSKKTDKKTAFIVTLRPYEKKYLPEIITTVWAKSRDKISAEDYRAALLASYPDSNTRPPMEVHIKAMP